VNEALMQYLGRFTMVALLLLFAACGGGEIGEDCDTRGSTDECVDGAICDQTSDGKMICLASCADASECADSEECNGVSGSNTKACFPKDSDKK
jgi:hypothetical protein